MTIKQIPLFLVASLLASFSSYANEALPLNEKSEQKKAESAASKFIETVHIIGHNDRLRTEAGSATLIGELELEKFKFDDINRVLYSVPGVNIREEDGYGLRPNIGFRGATPERSKKITVMEAGVLIGPAPYSAPAAYYFPMMSKMTSLEVFKGPAAIKYGPNTVAGSLNMTTRSVPDGEEGMFDLAIGSEGYLKLKSYFGDTIGNFGYVVEGVHMQADGFKELDNGGDTGFDKNDIMVKLQYDFSHQNIAQLLELKLAYADELSDESYLGLTDEDFASNPNRRYSASQSDLMDWQHQQIQLTHFIAFDNVEITTRLYRNDFKRSWNKINGIDGLLVDVNEDVRSLQDILANPYDGDGQAYDDFNLLTGESNTSVNEYIILGDNYREYYSQGLQTELYTSYSLFDIEHKVNAGVRYHQDQIKRFHTTAKYTMENQALMFSSQIDHGGSIYATHNVEETDALAVFIQDTIVLGNLDLTLGLRGEFFDSNYENYKDEDGWLKKESHIWLPSISGFYKLNESSGLFFGIHEGFIPTSPAEGEETDIENSINYELGGRYQSNGTKFELVAFFNDIKNLKESCSFSAGNCKELDQEFNGGEVDVYGLELTSNYTVNLSNGLELPLSLVYTHTQSEFKTSFNSYFPMWGAIEEGDTLPYLPENQFSASVGLIGNNWEMSLLARYIDDMKEASGKSFTDKYNYYMHVVLEGEQTKAYSVLDFSASYHLDDYGRIYFKADNLFDKQVIVSRRPYGARPSKPQMFQLGYQFEF